jgi:hypothetical protein
MGNPPKLSVTQMTKKVLTDLQGRINTFIEKRNKFEEEMAKDLEQMRIDYGKEIVNTILAQGGLPDKPQRRKKTQSDENGSDEPTTARRRINNPDLKAKVVEATNSLKGKQFTRREVLEVLKAQGVECDPNYVAVLVKGMPEIEVVKEHGLQNVGLMSVFQFKISSHSQLQSA